MPNGSYNEGAPAAPPPPPGGARVTVVILAYNEEPNIVECLRTCAWCDDVHVVDSGSTDRTVELARSMGATVHVNPFRSFGQQRNWAIDHVPHRHDWVFHLDADERLTPELVEEISAVVARDPAEAGYYVPHKLMFMGRWIRRAEGGSPVYQMRLFHRGRMRFQDWGHGQREDTAGRIGTLTKPYLHFNFSKGLGEWIEKHNRYSTLEAREQFNRLRMPTATHRFFGPPVERRRFLKERLLPRLPGSWLMRFLWMYVLRGGFTDGRPGLYYCLLMASYELFIRLKVEELSAEQKLGPAAGGAQGEPHRWVPRFVARRGPVV
ncbi:MAG TPA: glycosyltransferase family 2 protein [Humisphaera sp.]